MTRWLTQVGMLVRGMMSALVELANLWPTQIGSYSARREKSWAGSL